MTDIEELKNMEPSVRKNTILHINVLEKLEPEEDGVNLNEGYEYEVNGSLPQLADGLAKMFIEFDKDSTIGENSGEILLTLIIEYYNKLKTNE